MTLAQIAAAATNPFVLIGAAIVAVLLLLDDFATAMRGGKTYFNWDPAIKIFKSLREWGTTIEEWITSLPDKISKALTGIWETLRGWWTTAIDWMSKKWDSFIQTVTGWMPDALKKQIGISVEGSTTSAPQFAPVSASPVVARALNGPAPIAVPAATPGRLMTALADAQARAGGSTMINEGGSVSTVINNMAAGGRVLGAAQPLGSTTINSTDDHSRKYDIPVTVTNSTTVNVTTTSTDAGSIADQVGSAVDTSNAKLVRDMQSPLSAIADEPQTATSE